MKIVRGQERVAKSDLAALTAKRQAQLEYLCAKEYRFDENETWAKAHAIADAALEQASQMIATENETLGIPRAFAPTLNLCWFGRGENMVKDRRAEFLRVGYAKLEQQAKETKSEIERRSLRAQTQIMAIGFGTEAVSLLETLPTAEELLPPMITAEEIRRQLTSESFDDDM